MLTRIRQINQLQFIIKELFLFKKEILHSFTRKVQTNFISTKIAEFKTKKVLCIVLEKTRCMNQCRNSFSSKLNVVLTRILLLSLTYAIYYVQLTPTQYTNLPFEQLITFPKPPNIHLVPLSKV